MQQKLTMEQYKSIDAVSNGELLTIERNPSDYIWNKNAPTDELKTSALDFGTMTHTALLEPELFGKNLVIYDQTKSRETVKFAQFMKDVSKESIVLLESEYDKLRLMVDSAKAHPTFMHYLQLFTEFEQSITTELEGVAVKIRPDCQNNDIGLIGDLKTTADLDAWRESVTWRNPLFTFNYGHTAAFYMDAYQAHIGKPVNEYYFLVLQKNISLGKYPVDVVRITREECERYGFFDRVYANLEEYKARKASGDWLSVSNFPVFNVDNNVTVEFE